ncbi:MAG: hypothetical protein U0872_03230 [Planctomycetaceae bacterium]
MTSTRDRRLAVLTKPKDLQRAAELLSETTGIQPLDALIAMQHSPSVLHVPMTEGQGAAMVALLHGLGVKSVVVPCMELPNFENPVVIHHARCLPAAFEILETSGAPLGQIPWGSIAVAAIGAIPGRTAHHYSGQARTLVSAAPSAPVGPIDVPDTSLMELWILRRNHSAAYRLDHRRFNYEGLGDRKSTSATANFRLFAKEFVSHLSAASLTESTCAYLGQAPQSAYEFASRDDLQRAGLLHWVIFRTTMSAVEDGPVQP